LHEIKLTGQKRNTPHPPTSLELFMTKANSISYSINLIFPKLHGYFIGDDKLVSVIYRILKILGGYIDKDLLTCNLKIEKVS